MPTEPSVCKKNFFLMLSRLKINIILFLYRLRRGA